MQLIPHENQIIKPKVEMLEQVLRHHAHKKAFLLWRAFPSDGGEGFDKIPVDPADGVARSPNTARERGVLTLAEASEAVEALAAVDVQCGIGIFAEHAGIIAIDLDKCVHRNGRVNIDDWARDLTGQNYAEFSPSGTGLRCLVLTDGFDPELLKRANGHERASLGLYGPGCSKFVTLTGAIIEGAIPDVTKLPPERQAKIWSRWARDTTKASNPSTYGAFVGLYPAGRHGMNLALEDILDGTSLHPATVAFCAKAAHFMSRFEARESLHDAYHQSAAKTATPGRWNARYPKSIEGALEWIDGRDGWRRGFDVSTQTRQAAKALVERFTAEQAAADAEHAEVPLGQSTHVMNDDGSMTYRKHSEAGWQWRISADEIARLEADGLDLGELSYSELNEYRVIYMLDNDEPVPKELHDCEIYTDMLNDIAEDEAQAALDDLRSEAAKADVPYWVVSELPSETLRGLSEHVVARQRHDMPLLAVTSALTALSAATQNAFAVEFSSFVTPLNIYSIGVAPSGSGKDAGRQLVAEIAEMVGPNCVGGKVASEAGLYDTIVEADRQGKVLLWDEVWSLFEKLGQPQSTHESGMLAVLLESYSQGTGAISTTARAVRGNQNRPPVIYAPFVSLMGTTTMPRFIEAMSDKFLEDGLVGRTLFAVSAQGPIKPLGHKGPSELPEGLYEPLRGAVSAFRAVAHAFATGDLDRGLRVQVRRAGATAAGKAFIQVGLTDDRAIEIDRFSRELTGRFKAGSAMAAVATRAAVEQTLRIAGLCAVGKFIDLCTVLDLAPYQALNDYGIEIDDACIGYAEKLISHTLIELGELSGQFEGGETIAEKTNVRMRDKIIGALTDPDHVAVPKGREYLRTAVRQGWLSRSFVTYLLKHFRAVDRDSLIRTMIDEGTLTETKKLPYDCVSAGVRMKHDQQSDQWPDGWQFLGV